MLLLTPFDPIFLLVRILLVVGQNVCLYSWSLLAPYSVTALICEVYKGITNQTTRRSLPYADVFESAGELMRFTSSSALSSTSTINETPRTRSKRLKSDLERNSASVGSTDMNDASFSHDLIRFGQLSCVKSAMSKICEIHGGCLLLNLWSYTFSNKDALSHHFRSVYV